MSAIKQGIAEFINEKRALEDRLRTIVQAELSAFHALTGATVDGVNVSIMTMHLLGAPAERVVGSVRVDTPLD